MEPASGDATVDESPARTGGPATNGSTREPRRPAPTSPGAPTGLAADGEPEGAPAHDRLQAGRRDLVVVGWSHAGQHAYTAGLGIAIPFVVAAFHTNYAVVGALLSVCTIVGSCLQGLALVVRRVSVRTLLVGQNVGSAVAAVVSALSPGIGLFMFGRFIQATTGWPQHPVGSSYLSDRYPSRRGTILSWHVSAGNLGMLGAPLAVSAVIEAGGWRWGFWLLSAVLVTTVVVVALWLPTPWRRLRTPPPSETGPTRSFSQELAALVRQRPVLALLVAGTIAAGGQGIGILGVYVPAYLHTSLHFGGLKVGVLLTVMYVGAVIGPILVGTLADRVAHRPVLLASYVAGGLALAAFLVVGHDIGGLVAVCVATGIFSYSELSMRQTLFADFLPSGSLARAGFGIFFTVSQAVGAIWVAVIGAIITGAGFHAAFVTMAASFAAAGLVVFLGTGTRRGSRGAVAPAAQPSPGG